MAKSKMRSHFCRVQLFEKNEAGERVIKAGYKWMKVRANAAIPEDHNMWK